MDPRRNLQVCRLAISILIGALVLGCNAASEPAQSADIRLGDRDNGEQIELAPGQSLAITLAANPTTGFYWQPLEHDETVMVQSGSSYQMDAKEDPPPPGTGGWKTFLYEAVGTGRTTLTLVYQQTGEPAMEPIQVFTIEVVVH